MRSDPLPRTGGRSTKDRQARYIPLDSTYFQSLFDQDFEQQMLFGRDLVRLLEFAVDTTRWDGFLFSSCLESQGLDVSRDRSGVSTEPR
jgi:hypothetical protein